MNGFLASAPGQEVVELSSSGEAGHVNTRTRSAQEMPDGHLRLPADTRAPRIARQFVCHFLERRDMLGLLEPLTLVVSELVTNAVRHARPPFELSLRRLGEGVRVGVQDAGRHDALDISGPMRLPSRDDHRGGRGLFLVKAVSAKTGVDKVGDEGKRVWAVVEPQTPS